MFQYLRSNWGYIGPLSFLTVIGGIFFDAPLMEILYATALMAITIIALFMLEDVWPYQASLVLEPYTEEELLEMDELVANENQFIIGDVMVARDVHSH